MIKISINQFLFDTKGKQRKQVVLRKVNGKIIMAAYPDYSCVTWSEKQIMHRQRFKEASIKAKAIAAEPIQRARYKAKCKPGQTVYNIVLKELMIGEK